MLNATPYIGPVPNHIRHSVHRYPIINIADHVRGKVIERDHCVDMCSRTLPEGQEYTVCALHCYVLHTHY